MLRWLRAATPLVGWLSALAVGGGIALGLLAGACGWRFVCLAAVLVSVLAEPSLQTHAALPSKLLRQASLGLYARTLLRFLAVVAAGARTWTDTSVAGAVVVSASLVALGLAVDNLLRLRLRRRRMPAIETRNIPLDSLHVPPAPPEWLVSGNGTARAVVEIPVLLAACLVVSDATPAWVLGGIGVLLTLAIGVGMQRQIRAIGEALRADSMAAAVQTFLDEHRPTVVLYFSGNASSAYQVNMWLSTMERLPTRAVVVLRERRVLDSLGHTGLPVICVPAATTLLTLRFTDARVALYTANVGNNLHMLREPGTMSAFIGHGDSDKNASFNPFSRVYDEIWVAGQAGRERYRRASIGVRDEQVVEVGRPQLDSIERVSTRATGGVPTLLYAPTWEGWDAQQDYCSLEKVGRRLVEQVINHPTPIRLVYKPHPFTGLRNKATRRAHEDIVAMIAAANAAHGLAGPTYRRSVEADDTDDARYDAIALALRSTSEPGPSAIDAESRTATDDKAYWSSLDPTLHVAVGPDGPSLFSCFNTADLLVTDISSVLSDFQASGKPYAVCNPRTTDDAEFVRTFPSTAAATLVGRDGAGVDAVLALLDGTATDEAVANRRLLADELLGPADVPAMDRFSDAVAALTARSIARNTERHGTAGTDIDLADAIADPAGDLASEGQDGYGADAAALHQLALDAND